MHWCNSKCYNKDGTRVCGQGEQVAKPSAPENQIFTGDQLQILRDIFNANANLDTQYGLLQRLVDQLQSKHNEIEPINDRIVAIKNLLLELKDKLTTSLNTITITKNPNQMDILEDPIARDE